MSFKMIFTNDGNGRSVSNQAYHEMYVSYLSAKQMLGETLTQEELTALQEGHDWLFNDPSNPEGIDIDATTQSNNAQNPQIPRGQFKVKTNNGNGNGNGNGNN